MERREFNSQFELFEGDLQQVTPSNEPEGMDNKPGLVPGKSLNDSAGPVCRQPYNVVQ